MSAPGSLSRSVLLGLVLVLSAATSARAYTPGSGTLYTDNFDGTLDADWENGNGTSNSPWTQQPDGLDKVFYADGKGPFSWSPTRHWARHFVSPVTATTFSIALEFRAQLGTSYLFDLELNQRSPQLRKYRLRIDGTGVMSLWRVEGGTLVRKVQTAAGFIPASTKRWLRLAIDPGAGHPVVHARAWGGGAANEPATWNLEFTDDLDTLARVHNFELAADGPKGIQTWVDDVDAFGDKGNGIASSVTTIYIVEWTHLDIGFTLPPDDIEAYAKSHLDQVLQNLAAEPRYRWTIEESWYLDRWWERSTDAERQNLVNWLKDGRLRLAAGYASLHTTTAGQEELVRNIYYASKFARQHDVPLKFWITDDVPGTSFAVPEILARSGIPYFLGGMNTPFGGKLNHPGQGDRPFWWVGPDGSRVLAWTTFDAYAEAFDYGFSWFDSLADMYKKLGKKLPEQEEAGYRYPELMLMRAFDNNYSGFKARDMVDAWNSTYATPHFELTTPDVFLDMLRQKYGDASFPSFSGDYGCAWSNSHASAQHTEEWVRQAHRDGRSAEALLGVGSVLDGAPVPQDQVDFLYRRELEVDEHSGAGGWPGYWNPEQMDRNNRIHLGYVTDARDTAASLLATGVERTVASIPAAGDAVAVVNSLVRPRDGWARIALPAALYGSTFHVVDRATGTELPFQRFAATSEILFRAIGLPALGYRVYDLVPGAPSAVPGGTLSVTTTSLENDFYALTVSPADGSVSSLVEKSTGRQLIDPASTYRFNRLASNVSNEITAKTAPKQEAAGTVTLSIETNGPLVAGIKVARAGTAHTLAYYRLYRNEDRFEIENVFDRSKMPYVNNSIGTRAYTVTLPFNVHDLQIRSESTTRFVDPLHDGFDRPDVFDWHNVEHTLAFWDTGGGILYACNAVDSHFFGTFSGLSSATWSTANGLLLSRMYDRTDEYEFADGSIGPYTMEPGTGDILHYVHHVRATGSGFDAPSASRFGFEALNAPQTRLLSARPGWLPGDSASFLAVDAPGVVPYTVKRADDGDGLVLRMTELTGATTPVRVTSGVFRFEGAFAIGPDESGGTPVPFDPSGVSVTLSPYETATLRLRASVPVTPVVLSVSRGTGANVHLEWSGGRAPFTLRRAEDPGFTRGVVTLIDGQNVTHYDDPVFADGTTYYYQVN